MVKSPNRRFAFTLVEILVVLGIVALLSALLLGVLSRVRENGRRTVCLSNQKQILLALQLYQEDSAGLFPFHNPLETQPAIWMDSLLSYTKTPQVFICPSDTEIDDTKKYGFLTGPSGRKTPTVPASYIVNEELQWHQEKGKMRPRALSEVTRPASTVFLCDGAKEASPQQPYWTNDVIGLGSIANGLAMLGYALRDPGHSTDTSANSDPYAPNPRHGGRALVGFVDGHVKSLDLTRWYFPNTPYIDPVRGG